MITGFYQSIIILGIIVVAFMLDFVLMNRYKRSRQAQGSKPAWSWDYSLILLIASIVLILQPFLFPGFGFTTPKVWGLFLQILGLGLVIGALALHIWARLHLRHFYAERVEIQAEHHLVDTGLRVVDHLQ